MSRSTKILLLLFTSLIFTSIDIVLTDVILVSVSTEQRRMYIARSYVFRYDEPAESEWGEHAKEIAEECGLANERTVISVWQTLIDCHDAR